MKNYFDTLIQPKQSLLSKMLGFDDDTVIPITVIHASGTKQVIEDGYVMECDHAGATEQTKSALHMHGNFQTGNYEMEWKDVEVLTCDKCDAQMGDDGEWYE